MLCSKGYRHPLIAITRNFSLKVYKCSKDVVRLNFVNVLGFYVLSKLGNLVSPGKLLDEQS